jgi:hypothetical protein
MNTEKKITLFGLTIKTIIVHTVTYFIMGLVALTFLESRINCIDLWNTRPAGFSFARLG